MAKSDLNSDLVAELAEEFVERYRAGERPPLSEYTDKHPTLADEIRDVFPALVMVENLAPKNDESIFDAQPQQCDLADSIENRQLGDYHIIREVGRGGMGIVYEAEQQSLGRRVALKVLPKQMLLDSNQRKRFEREAKAAAKLHHTNIVPVFGVGEHEGLHFYVMQFIQGLGLDEVLVELRTLREETSGTSEREKGSTKNELKQGERSRSVRADVSAGAVARSLVSGQFERTLILDRPEWGGHDVAASEPSFMKPDALHETPASATRDTVVGRLSDTHPLSKSVVLPGQSDDDSKAKSSKATYAQSVARIGVQVAEALDYAHEQGILHRDIKPSNLLLDTRGTVWVTDFGLAKTDDHENLTGTGDIVGTLRYMAPEMFNGKADVRSDIYALGLTLYELLALKPAFDESDRHKLIRLVGSQTPERLQKFDAHIPKDLETIVHKAIDRDPSHRYQSAAELAQDLQRYLDDEPIHARRISPVARFSRWCKRNPLIASLTSTIVILLITASVVSSLASQKFEDLADERQNALVAATDAQGKAEQKSELAEREKKAAEAAQEQEAKSRQEADRQREVAKYNLYLAEMRLGHQDWQAGQLTRLQATLAKHIPQDWQADLRGWEWHYLNSLCHKDLLTLRGHQGAVFTVKWSPNGSFFASGDRAGVLKVWNAETGAVLVTRQTGQKTIRSIAWSPDGQRLASAGGAGKFQIWNSNTLEEILSIPTQTDRLFSVAWSPDGKQIAAGGLGGEGNIILFDAASGESVLEFKSGDIYELAWSPDGRRIACGSNGRTVKVFDATTGHEMKTLTLSGVYNVFSVSWSPDGKRLAAGTYQRIARVWETESWREIITIVHKGGVEEVRWHPNSRWLATATRSQRVRVWDTDSGEEVRSFHGHTDWVLSVHWSPDGQHLVSASRDRTIKVWDVKLEQESLTLGQTYGKQIVWSPLGDRFATVGNGRIDLWHFGNAPKLRSFEGTSCAWSPDAERLAVYHDNKNVTIWNTRTWNKIRTFEVGGMSDRGGMVWSPNSDHLSIADLEGGLAIWSVAEAKKILSISADRKRVFNQAWSPDGRHLAASGFDGDVKIWALASPDRLRVFKWPQHTWWTGGLSWSPDGKRLVSGGWDQIIRVWDVAKGTEVLSLIGHSGAIFSFSWSPDGRRIASAGFDGNVKLWDAATGIEILTLEAFTGEVHSVRWSPDGKWLAAIGVGGLKLWNASEDNDVLRHLIHQNDLLTAARTVQRNEPNKGTSSETGEPAVSRRPVAAPKPNRATKQE